MHDKSLRPSRPALALAILGPTLATLVWSPAPAATGAGRPAAPEPTTRITDSPGPKTFQRRPRFSFDSPSGSVHFQCALGRGRWRPCSSPHRTRRLADGRHTFRVRALASGRVADSTPAERRFRVLGRRVAFGHSVRGAELDAVRLGDPNAARKALVVGSIHGNEAEGQEIVHVLKHSYRDLRGVELWVVKSVNPDGVKAGTRQNARGVDLNRNFSYHWRGGVPRSSGDYPGPHPFSEPESRAVRRLAKRVRPQVTIWYHQPWGQVLLPCHGPAPTQKRYARIAHSPTKRCRGQRLPGTASQLAEPPSPRHRVRGRAAGRRAAGRPGAPPRSRGGEGGGARGRCQAHGPRRLVEPRCSCQAAAAADRPRPDPLRAPAKAPDGRLLEAPLRKTPVAPSPSAGDRPALHRRPDVQVRVGDVRLRRSQHGRAARGLLALRGRKERAHSPARPAGDPLPAHDRAEPPRDRGRDGAGGRAKLALGRPPDPSPRPPDPRRSAPGRLAQAALRDQDAGT